MDRLPTVLFKDCSDLWCPLNSLYWSQQTNILVSKHPNSCVHEIVSIYCPQCLTRYTEDESTSFNNRCSVCKVCPFCSSTLSADGDNLVCGMCFWTCPKEKSQPVNIFPEKLSFNRILSRYKEKDVDDAHQKLKDLTSQRSNMASDPKVLWQMEDLRKKLDASLSPDDESEAIEQAALAGYCQDREAQEASDHKKGQRYPAAVPLRSKRTIRGRLQDVSAATGSSSSMLTGAAGRMNILVQPKTLPLEGDSSLKVQRGKWWVKDASAIHDVPFVSVVQLPCRQKQTPSTASAASTAATIELCFTNPKEVATSIRFFLKSGIEQQVDGDGANTNTITTATTIPSDPSCSYVALDPITGSATRFDSVPAAQLLRYDAATETESNSNYDSSCARHGGTAAYYEVPLAAYEDELLKDASAEEQQVQVLVQVQAVGEGEAGTGSKAQGEAARYPPLQVHRPQQGSSSSSSSSPSPGTTEVDEPVFGNWGFRAVHNKSYVRIPITLPAAPFHTDSRGQEQEVVQLQLTGVIKMGKTDVTFPIKVLFPL
jgi:hypothetical protein